MSFSPKAGEYSTPVDPVSKSFSSDTANESMLGKQEPSRPEPKPEPNTPYCLYTQEQEAEEARVKTVKATSSDGEEEAQEIISRVIHLKSLQVENVGLFIGKRKINLKKHVLDKGIAHFPDLQKVQHIDIKTQKGKVYASLKAGNQEHMEVLVDSLHKHLHMHLKHMKFKGQSRYVFKVGMNHQKIGLFIGASGKNLGNLATKIQENDENLQSDKKIDIHVKQDGKIRMQRLTFTDLTSGQETTEKVLITLSIYTNNRDNSYSILKRLVEEEIEEFNTRRVDQGKNNDFELDDDVDPFEDGGW